MDIIFTLFCVVLTILVMFIVVLAVFAFIGNQPAQTAIECAKHLNLANCKP